MINPPTTSEYRQKMSLIYRDKKKLGREERAIVAVSAECRKYCLLP
jgi:hypothetical protein